MTVNNSLYDLRDKKYFIEILNFGDFAFIWERGWFDGKIVNFSNRSTPWKVFKYGVISGPYFPVFGLTVEIYGMNFEKDIEKYGPEITPYLDTIHAVKYKVSLSRL